MAIIICCAYLREFFPVYQSDQFASRHRIRIHAFDFLPPWIWGQVWYSGFRFRKKCTIYMNLQCFAVINFTLSTKSMDYEDRTVLGKRFSSHCLDA